MSNEAINELTEAIDIAGRVNQSIFEFKVEDIIRDEVINLRPFTNGADSDVESIQELADAIKQHGQIEPVVVRVDEQAQPHLIAGNRRVTAISLLNAGLEEGVEPYRVKAVVTLSADTDTAAWAMAWSENKDRKNMSPMDVAMNLTRARHMYLLKGKAGTKELAVRLGVSPAYVTTHEKLLKLGEEIQAKVHKGELGVDAALKVEAVPEEKRDEVIEVAKGIAESEQSKGDAAQSDGRGGVADKSRKAKAAKGGRGGVKARHITQAKRKVAGASKKAEPRTKGELVEFVESELLSPVFGYANGDVHKFAAYLLGWLKGEGTDRGLVERFKECTMGASAGSPPVDVMTGTSSSGGKVKIGKITVHAGKAASKKPSSKPKAKAKSKSKSKSKKTK